MNTLKSLDKLFEGRHRLSCLRTTIALQIHCVNLRHAPGQIQSNSRYVHDEGSFAVGIGLAQFGTNRRGLAEGVHHIRAGRSQL
jgi:hypothetical protein